MIYWNVAIMLTLWQVNAEYATINNRTSYKGYKTYEFFVETDLQLKAINSLKDIPGIDFWTEGGKSAPTVVMITPEKIQNFQTVLKELEVPFRTLIPDVNKYIEKENLEQELARFANYRSYDSYLYKYLRYEEIINFVETMKGRFPNNVKIETIGKSFENRKIVLVKLSNNFYLKKKIIFLEAGMHAREWASPALAIHAINQILEEPELLMNSDWYIIPLSNPDGYEYSHNFNRLWRKTRSYSYIEPRCFGVDGNRNFDSHWGEHSSSDPCEANYHGIHPFSETETEAVWFAVSKIQNRIQTFISLHSYGNKILYPYSFTEMPIPDWEKLDQCGLEAREAVLLNGGPPFTVGSTARVLYLASGGVDDFMKEKMMVPFAYTVELPGGGPNGFDYPPNEIHILLNISFPVIKAISQCSLR